MPRYIDAEKVKDHFLTAYPLLQRERLMTTIDGVPAADVEKVRHGKWIGTMCGDKCSECGCIHDALNYGMYDKYCRSCGARMDGK